MFYNVCSYPGAPVLLCQRKLLYHASLLFLFSLSYVKKSFISASDQLFQPGALSLSAIPTKSFVIQQRELSSALRLFYNGYRSFDSTIIVFETDVTALLALHRLLVLFF